MKFILLVLFTVTSAVPLPDDDAKLYLSDRSIDDSRLSSVIYNTGRVKDESIEGADLPFDDDVYVTLSKPRHYVEVNKPVIKAPVFKQPIYEEFAFEKPVLKNQVMKYEIKDAIIPAPAEKVEYESMKISAPSSGGDVFLTHTEPKRYVELRKPVIKEPVFKQPIYKETLYVEPVHKAPVVEYKIKEVELPSPIVKHKSLKIPDVSSDDNEYVILSKPTHQLKMKKPIIKEPVFKRPLLEEIAYLKSVDDTPSIEYEVVEAKAFPVGFRNVPPSNIYTRPVVFKQSINKED